MCEFLGRAQTREKYCHVSNNIFVKILVVHLWCLPTRLVHSTKKGGLDADKVLHPSIVGLTPIESPEITMTSAWTKFYSFLAIDNPIAQKNLNKKSEKCCGHTLCIASRLFILIHVA